MKEEKWSSLTQIWKSCSVYDRKRKEGPSHWFNQMLPDTFSLRLYTSKWGCRCTLPGGAPGTIAHLQRRKFHSPEENGCFESGVALYSMELPTKTTPSAGSIPQICRNFLAVNWKPNIYLRFHQFSFRPFGIFCYLSLSSNIKYWRWEIFISLRPNKFQPLFCFVFLFLLLFVLCFEVRKLFLYCRMSW